MSSEVKSKALEEAGFKEEEYIELARDNQGNQTYGYTGFPAPAQRYQLTIEEHARSIEEVYFWLYEHLKQDQAFADFVKITDLFAASEQSAFFGSAKQRIGLQQDKVIQFLATIGKMVRDLFQLVRELRILDERLSIYKDSYDLESKSRESAEITLKGIWIDLVEQGAKNPASVYGMARELQFTTLPDLFFSTHPLSVSAIDETVDKLEFNRKVKEVLKRKLRTFMAWKDFTYKEMQNRRKFTLQFLRQHFDVIRMYMSWVKPYLRDIRRLELMDQTKSPDLIAAFEGSIIEIEYLAKRLPASFDMLKEIKYNQHVYTVVLVHILYRTKPQLNYMQEYQRGPIHVGKFTLTLRCYGWTQKEIDAYINMKLKEDMELLKVIDGSVKAAMEALGDELEKYLQEAGEDIKFTNKEKPKITPKAMADPFTSIFKGFGQIFGALKRKEEGGVSKYVLEKERAKAISSGKDNIWNTYKNLKKREGLLAW
ncbi:MAG: hypothetical protein QXK37_04310 [Candidatus Woesearchaeota archaeon]